MIALAAALLWLGPSMQGNAGPPSVVRRVAPAAALPMSAESAQAVDAATRPLLSALTELDRLEGGSDDRTIARRRVELAERARRLDVRVGLPEDREAVQRAFARTVHAIDGSNTAFLKRRMPPAGWFDIRTHGAALSHDAWLIVQHSADRELQTGVLAQMQALVGTGRVHSADYALLYDRMALMSGRPQRYGSQLRCENGRMVPFDLEDPPAVEARRSDMGLKPLQDYLASAAKGCGPRPR